MKTDHYKHIRMYAIEITKKEQCSYAINQINKERQRISVYGRQLYRNMRLRELDDIESIVNNKMILFGITDVFNWAGVTVFIKDAEIIIKLV